MRAGTDTKPFDDAGRFAAWLKLDDRIWRTLDRRATRTRKAPIGVGSPAGRLGPHTAPAQLGLWPMILALALGSSPQHSVAAGLAAPIAAEGKTPILTLHAEGVQIYQCKVDASGARIWQFREPLATLLQDGKTEGRHFAGPTWELSDGSAIVGKVAAQTAGGGPNDVAWLKLVVVEHKGQGVLSAVTTVQRINTRGGAFAGSCDRDGELHLERYSADYVFLTD